MSSVVVGWVFQSVVGSNASTSSVGSRRIRLASRCRRGVVLTTFVGLSLAMATPGLAADELVPGVEIPAPPAVATNAPVTAPATDTTEPPTLESSPSAPTATEPPITVSVNADGGNIDVSVRVLSPGEDAGDAAEPPVISGSDVPDITSATVPDSDLRDDPTGDGTQGSNTNVTVRVLSPGETGPVVQSKPLEAPEPTKETTHAAAETETTVTDAEEAAPRATSDSAIPPKEGEQYQSADSRYQSYEQFSEDAWSWSWYLSLDCDGNATSSSTETGRQSSRDWRWEWTWEWDCGSPPHPPPVDSLEPALGGDATRAAPGPSEKDATATGPVDEAASGDGVALNQPWLWTWIFTFCGETVTATLPIDTMAALEWVWEWMWTWSCRIETAPAPSEGAPDPSSAPSTGTASGPSANAPATATPGVDAPQVEPWFPSVKPVELPAWVISLVPFPEFGRDGTIRLVPVLDHLTRAGLISPLFEVAAITLPFVGPAAPVDSADAPAAFDSLVTSSRGPQLRERAGTPAATMPVVIGGSFPARAQPHSVGPRVEKASPAKRDVAGRRSRGTPRAPWLPPRPFQSAGAPASSGFVPSTSLLGMAALVALFILAAPWFGRRIRVAHELRPRGTYGSSIDRPG